MGFKIKNSLTGEFEKLPILTLKGEKGETGGVEEYNKVDYMGNKYETLKQANDANVEYAVKTAIGEFNYLDYDGQHITATDTIEGRSKSAILTGQTLVNLFPNLLTGEFKKNTTTKDGDSLIFSKGSVLELGADKIKTSTTYTFILDIKENTLVGNGVLFQVVHNATSISSTGLTLTNEVGLVKLKTTTLNNLAGKNICLYVRDNATSGEIKIKSIMLLEGDYTNVDIPYFEGMQSVKMPVLTTIGKNLFDINFINTIYSNFNNNATVKIDNNSFTMTSSANNRSYLSQNKPIILKPNTVYTLSLTGYSTGDYKRINIGSSNGVDINDYRTITLGTNEATYSTQFRTNKSGHVYINFYPTTSAESLTTISNIQLEEGSQSTSYEPYKSSILTVNEDVELRGIGDVKDTLDLTTGELVQNFGSLYFDGSENWNIYNRVGTMAVAKLNLPNLEHKFYAPLLTVSQNEKTLGVFR